MDALRSDNPSPVSLQKLKQITMKVGKAAMMMRGLGNKAGFGGVQFQKPRSYFRCKEILTRSGQGREKITNYELNELAEFMTTYLLGIKDFVRKFQLSWDQTVVLCSKFTLVHYEFSRSTVFEEGDKADAFYAILTGAVVVKIKSKTGGHVQVVRTLGPGDTFGELGLLQESENTDNELEEQSKTQEGSEVEVENKEEEEMNVDSQMNIIGANGRRGATVQTAEPRTELLKMDRVDYMRFMRHFHKKAIDDKFEFLRRCAIFSHLPDDDLKTIARVTSVKRYNVGSILFRQGELVDNTMFVPIIRKGECAVTVTIPEYHFSDSANDVSIDTRVRPPTSVRSNLSQDNVATPKSSHALSRRPSVWRSNSVFSVAPEMADKKSKKGYKLLSISSKEQRKAIESQSLNSKTKKSKEKLPKAQNNIEIAQNKQDFIPTPRKHYVSRRGSTGEELWNRLRQDITAVTRSEKAKEKITLSLGLGEDDLEPCVDLDVCILGPGEAVCEKSHLQHIVAEGATQAFARGRFGTDHSIEEKSEGEIGTEFDRTRSGSNSPSWLYKARKAGMSKRDIPHCCTITCQTCVELWVLSKQDLLIHIGPEAMLGFVDGSIEIPPFRHLAVIQERCEKWHQYRSSVLRKTLSETAGRALHVENDHFEMQRISKTRRIVIEAKYRSARKQMPTGKLPDNITRQVPILYDIYHDNGHPQLTQYQSTQSAKRKPSLSPRSATAVMRQPLSPNSSHSIHYEAQDQDRGGPFRRHNPQPPSTKAQRRATVAVTQRKVLVGSGAGLDQSDNLLMGESIDKNKSKEDNPSSPKESGKVRKKVQISIPDGHVSPEEDSSPRFKLPKHSISPRTPKSTCYRRRGVDSSLSTSFISLPSVYNEVLSPKKDEEEQFFSLETGLSVPEGQALYIKDSFVGLSRNMRGCFELPVGVTLDVSDSIRISTSNKPITPVYRK